VEAFGGFHLSGCVRDDPGRGFRIALAGASSAATISLLACPVSQLDERMRLRISRVAAMARGVLGILLGLACEGRMSPTSLLATAIAASATFHCCSWHLLGGFDARGRSLAAPSALSHRCFDGNGANYPGRRYWVLVLRSFRTTRRHCSRCPSRCLSAGCINRRAKPRRIGGLPNCRRSILESSCLILQAHRKLLHDARSPTLF